MGLLYILNWGLRSEYAQPAYRILGFPPGGKPYEDHLTQKKPAADCSVAGDLSVWVQWKRNGISLNTLTKLPDLLTK